MNIRWVPTVIGLAIAFALLAFVTKISIFGVTCYAVGEINFFGNMRCLHPAVYWGAWVVAVILILIGIRVPMPGSSSSSPSSPSSEPAAPSSGFGSHDAGAESSPVVARRVVAVMVVVALVGLLIAGSVTYNNYSGSRTAEVAPGIDTTQPPAEVPLPQPPPPAIGPDGLPIQPSPPSATPSTEPPPPTIGPDGLPIATPSQPPSSPLPVPGQYRWSGRATTPDGRSLGLAVVFDPTGDAGIEWADLRCGGTLTFSRASGPSFEYVERITYGAIDCMPKGMVTMTAIENGAAIEFQKDLGAARVVAQLRPF